MPIVIATPLPTGTGLDLCSIWMNAAADLGDMMAFQYAGDSIALSGSIDGEVRKLATRRRVIRSAGAKVYLNPSLTLLRCSATQRQWLRDHLGQVLCVRDHVGTKVYAVYFQAPFEVSTFPREDTYFTDVNLSMEQVDHSEAV